jgi:hypothetical protein
MLAQAAPGQTHCGWLLLPLGSARLRSGWSCTRTFRQTLESVLSKIMLGESLIIIFIDKMYTLVGAGKVNGGMDASHRGKLHCVGATTQEVQQASGERRGVGAPLPAPLRGRANGQ